MALLRIQTTCSSGITQIRDQLVTHATKRHYNLDTDRFMMDKWRRLCMSVCLSVMDVYYLCMSPVCFGGSDSVVQSSPGGLTLL